MELTVRRREFLSFALAGASSNRGTRPRMVQYVNMFPTRVEEHEEWI